MASSLSDLRVTSRGFLCSKCSLWKAPTAGHVKCCWQYWGERIITELKILLIQRSSAESLVGDTSISLFGTPCHHELRATSISLFVSKMIVPVKSIGQEKRFINFVCGVIGTRRPLENWIEARYDVVVVRSTKRVTVTNWCPLGGFVARNMR